LSYVSNKAVLREPSIVTRPRMRVNDLVPLNLQPLRSAGSEPPARAAGSVFQLDPPGGNLRPNGVSPVEIPGFPRGLAFRDSGFHPRLEVPGNALGGR